MSLQSSFISWKHATNPYCSTLAVVILHFLVLETTLVNGENRCLIVEEGWFNWTCGSTRTRKSSKHMSLDKACKSFKPKTMKLEGGDRISIHVDCKRNKSTNGRDTIYLENDCVSLREILQIYCSKILWKSDSISRYETPWPTHEWHERYF